MEQLITLFNLRKFSPRIPLLAMLLFCLCQTSIAQTGRTSYTVYNGSGNTWFNIKKGNEVVYKQMISPVSDVPSQVNAYAEAQASRALKAYLRLGNPSAAQLRNALNNNGPVSGNNTPGGTLSTCTYSGSLAAGDLTMGSRLSRPGAPTGSCAAAYTTPATIAGGPFYYDTYTLTNTTGSAQCVAITLTTTDLTNANIQWAAYTGSFVPANLVTNYLADPGVSTGTPAAATGISSNVTIPAAATIVFIVFSTNPNTAASGTASAYTLTVVDNNPGISSQPVNANATCPTGNASFSVTGSGSALTYQWQVDPGTGFVAVSNNATYSGAQASTLNITGATGTMSGYKYRAIVNGNGICGAGTAVTSNSATLTVGLAAPTVSPASLNVCAGTPLPLSITSASGFGAPVTVSFPSGNLGTDIPENVAGINNTVTVSGIPPGAVITAASVTLNITHTYVGDVMISLKAPNNSILNLDNLLTGTNNPGANFVNTIIGSTGVTALSSGIAPGFTGLFKPDGNTAATGAFGFPAGATGYLPNVPTFAGLYSVPNGPWTIAMYDAGPPDVGKLTNWTLNITYTPIVPYTGTWTPSTGLFLNATGTPYTGTAVSTVYANPAANTNYSVVISNGSCTSPATIVPVTVSQPPSFTAQPGNKSVCTDKTTTFAAVASSGTYQWQVDPGTGFINVSNGTNYSGATTGTLSIIAPPVSWNGYKYRVVVTGVSPCGTVNSNPATLTVNPLPVITVNAAPYSRLFPGLTTTLTASSAPAAATYAWYLNGVAIPGATAGNYTVNVNGQGDYTVNVTDVNGCTSTSSVKTIADSANGRLFIMPNPNKGVFEVRYYSVAGNVLPRSLIIYDAKGARVYVKDFSVGSPYAPMNVDLTRFKNGTYWVEVADRNGKRLKFGKVVVL